MEGLEVAAAPEISDVSRTPDRPLAARESFIRLAPRIRLALQSLLEAMEYADDLAESIWDFAIELAPLRRLELTNSDLRWLIGRGLVEHAVEVTSDGDVHRSFRQPSRPFFSKKTCFVLTSAGAALSREICGRRETIIRPAGRLGIAATRLPRVTAPERLVPRWDRDRQELRVGSTLIKRFKVPASNQEAILAAFEEESWPPRIDDPLPPHPEQSPKRRLQETIKSLNRNQKQPLVRFLGDGSGQGVRWEFRGPNDTSCGAESASSECVCVR